MAEQKHIVLRIKRQEGPGKPAYWDEFKLPYRANANIISCLMEIQRNPVTSEGKRVTPVVWDCNCLEEVCGACTMVINGKVRQSCSALADNFAQPIILEPMKSFPVIRDLMVDRSRMFEALKRVKAWIPIDGTHDLGPGPRQATEEQDWMYTLSTCMTCGCCTEACPNYNEGTEFVGPAAISQVRLFNNHPTGKNNAGERLDGLMGPGGINECGNSQNCVKACPKEIPLTTSIADVNRQITGHALKQLFRK
ncbi:MAG TPA: succinate dehydrogenase iron-sulfur subunit [Symbiobacteriaceae bacterium]|nr:succinate dehydrogenase iron-sulfur subunit [Symbiobacteriaceae bacterium]